MMRSIHTRLLLSYLAITALLACILFATLFTVATSVDLRTNSVGDELRRLSRPIIGELQRTLKKPSHLSNDELFAQMDQIAETAEVRLLFVARQRNEVIYDSENKWDNNILPIQLNNNFQGNPNTAITYNPKQSKTKWIIYNDPDPKMQFGRGLTLVFAKEEPPRLGFFTQSFGRPLAISVGVVGLASLLLASLLANSISKPLQRLATATQKVANGDYTQSVPLDGPEEIQTVSSQFNEMVEKVLLSQQAQKQFVSNVSHDLKTPITSIQGWSQAILDGTIVNVNQDSKAVHIIHEEAGRMSRMVERLLDLAKLESQHHSAEEPINLAEILSHVQTIYLPSAHEKQITLTTHIETSPLQIQGDGDRLIQLFSNLVDNSLLHTPIGGTVSLSIEEQMGQIIAQVADNGVGISAEKLPHIFERFYQADGARVRSGNSHGVGLGLPIVKEIVRHHHGQIDVKSEEGNGTIFTLTFPKYEEL